MVSVLRAASISLYPAAVVAGARASQGGATTTRREAGAEAGEARLLDEEEGAAVGDSLGTMATRGGAGR